MESTSQPINFRSCTRPNYPKRGNMLKHKNTPYGNILINYVFKCSHRGFMYKYACTHTISE